MKKLLTENIGLKISAVLISVFLWFFVTSRGQSEIAFDIPLEFKNIPANTGIVNVSVKTISVTVRGQERAMKHLKGSDVRVYVDLSKTKKGTEVIYISKDDIKLPYALSVMNISPASVKVKLDETISRTFPVNPVLTGEPRSGYFVSSIKVEPKSVVIKGLKSDVLKLHILKTEPVYIADSIGTISQDVNIDTGAANVTPDVETVKVTINISRR